MATILLVEDETQWSVPEERWLKELGHEVAWTDASRMAWKYLEEAYKQKKPFHLAVIDLVYIRREPSGTTSFKEGLRLLKRIRKDERFCQLPVIATTAYLQGDSRATGISWRPEAMEHGADEFFEQPVDEYAFKETVKRLLGGRTSVRDRNKRNGGDSK